MKQRGTEVTYRLRNNKEQYTLVRPWPWVNLSLAIRYGPSHRSRPNLMVLVKGLPTYTWENLYIHVNINAM